MPVLLTKPKFKFKLNFDIEKPSLMPKDDLSDIHPSMTGKYLEYMKIEPDEEGVAVIPQKIANLLTGEDNFGGTGFSVDKEMYQMLGLPQKYKVFINEGQLNAWTEEMKDSPYTRDDLLEYLKGHELTHANLISPRTGIGNQGFFPTKTGKAHEFSSLSGMENWLAKGYSGGQKWRRPQERLAHIGGMKRMLERKKEFSTEKKLQQLKKAEAGEVKKYKLNFGEPTKVGKVGSAITDAALKIGTQEEWEKRQAEIKEQAKQIPEGVKGLGTIFKAITPGLRKAGAYTPEEKKSMLQGLQFVGNAVNEFIWRPLTGWYQSMLKEVSKRQYKTEDYVKGTADFQSLPRAMVRGLLGLENVTGAEILEAGGIPKTEDLMAKHPVLAVGKEIWGATLDVLPLPILQPLGTLNKMLKEGKYAAAEKLALETSEQIAKARYAQMGNPIDDIPWENLPQQTKNVAIKMIGETPIKQMGDKSIADIFYEHPGKAWAKVAKGKIVSVAGEARLPFKIGDVVRLGGQTGKISKIIGVKALVNIAGKEVATELSKLIPIGNKAQGEGKPPVEPPKLSEVGEPPQPEENPVQKVISALKEAKSVRKQQEALYTKERGKKIARAKAVGEKVKGEKGFYAELGQLKGKLPKAQFEAIRSKVGQGDIDSLFDDIKESPLMGEWQKINARTGLAKLFGEYGGVVPTEGELKLLKKVFGEEFVKAVLDKRDIWTKLKQAGYQIANIPRSIMASFDFSAPFRQGVFFIGRGKQFWPAFGRMFKPFFSEKSFQTLQEEIIRRPTAKLMDRSKLSLTGLEETLGEREEAFMSFWAEKIPGIGHIVRASGRAYIGFLNKLRADVFDDLIKKAENLGLNPEENIDLSKAIAHFINTATGRGSLKGIGLEKATIGLNSFFFSPRLMASRISLLNPHFYITQPPFVRKEALKSLLSFGSIALTILAIAKLAGMEVGADPRSSDFGKIKIGNTRIDIFGGFQPYVRMAAQLITGEYVSSTTGKIYTLGEGYKPLTRYGILLRQIEGKFSPALSFVVGLLKGQTFTGEPVSVPKELGMRFVPMTIQDLYDILKDNPALWPLTGLAVFGVGVQTYAPRKKKKKKKLRGGYRLKF